MRHPMKHLKTAATVIVSVLATLIVAPTVADAASPQLPYWMSQPCRHAYNTNCHYTGPGPDFYARTMASNKVTGTPRTFCIFYVDRAYARKHDLCTRLATRVQLADAQRPR